MHNNRNFNCLWDAKLFVRKTQKRTIVSGLILGCLLVIFWSESIGFGFISGVAIGVVNFQLMSVDAYSIMDKNPKNARKSIIVKSFFRYAIMFGFLAYVAALTDLNIFFTFIGVFFIKTVIVAGEIIQGLNLTGKTFRG